jgi:excisionase family DNA binding protein
MTTRENQRSTPESDDWLSVTAAAGLLAVSRRTIYRYIELGHLPKRQLPGNRVRLARADVLALLKESERSA